MSRFLEGLFYGRDAVSGLPARQAERPARVSAGALSIGRVGCCISYPDFEEWRAQAHAFEGLAFVGERSISLRDGDGRAIDTQTFIVSANTFGLLGVTPMIGRDFVPADEVPGAAPVAILNYRFWESRFGKSADIVGSTVQINAAPATIIGVMPARFDFPTRENLWMPAVRTPELQQREITPRGFTAVGRLRDGVSLQEARAELETTTGSFSGSGIETVTEAPTVRVVDRRFDDGYARSLAHTLQIARSAWKLE